MTVKKQPELYFVGVGPGDPELLTLKAVHLIQRCDVLFVPVRKKTTTESMALNVVKKALNLTHKQIVFLPFPMVKGAQQMMSALAPAVAMMKAALGDAKTGVFITLGCSTIYSTAGNLFLALQDDTLAMQFVPGVSAVSGTAASCGMPLVFSEEKLIIVPATYAMDHIERYLERFETVVLMKAHSSMDAIIELICRKGLSKNAFVVERATTSEERIHSIANLAKGYRPHYMSTVVIKTNKGAKIDDAHG